MFHIFASVSGVKIKMLPPLFGNSVGEVALFIRLDYYLPLRSRSKPITVNAALKSRSSKLMV